MTMQETTLKDSPTVRQIRIAFEQTPAKLRAAEQGWRKRRQEEMERPVRISSTQSGAAVYGAGPRARNPAVARAEPKAAQLIRHITTPPTPPMTPTTDKQTFMNEGIDKDEERPRPILAHPLAPLLGTMPLGRNGSLSIPQSSSSRYELLLRIGNQRVSVVRGGDSLEIQSGGSSRIIHRSEYRGWSRPERKQWEMVRDLVEQVKRKTPRIKIYHPSATIVITCSSPPDVIIAFTMHRDPSSSKRTSSQRQSVTAVKLVYSPGRKKMVIDTTREHLMKSEGTFRTRRCVPVPLSSPSSLDTQKGSSTAHAALGFTVDGDWLEAEVEALERFWALRAEWPR